MRVLQIEGDRASAHSVELMLMASGFKVYTTDLGEEGVDLARVYDYDLILLDLNLPDMSGMDVLRTLRAAKVATPVVMFTGAAGIEAEVKSFSLGADDFLRKPLHKDVLIQRCSAVIRRSRGHAGAVVTVGPITVDLVAKSVAVGGAHVHLTGREYQMLELLALRRGITLTKEMFLNHLYGGLDEPELKIIDVFICKLRKKLNTAARHLETVWGRGYRLVERPESEPAPFRPAEALSMRGRLLERLRQGDATFEELRRLDASWPAVSVRGAVAALLGRGLVVNVGDPRAALYRSVQPGSEDVAA